MQGICQVGGRSRLRRKGGSEAKHITRAMTTGDYAKKPIFAFVILGLFLFLATPPVHAGNSGPWSVFVYGGKWSDNRRNEIVRGRTEMRRSYVWVAGAAKTLSSFGDWLSVEGEFNIARNTGRQDHFEVNTAVALRWRAFPWSRLLLQFPMAWGSPMLLKGLPLKMNRSGEPQAPWSSCPPS